MGKCGNSIINKWLNGLMVKLLLTLVINRAIQQLTNTAIKQFHLAKPFQRISNLT